VVTADTSAAGEFHGTITVSSDGGIATIPVRVRVDAPLTPPQPAGATGRRAPAPATADVGPSPRQNPAPVTAAKSTGKVPSETLPSPAAPIAAPAAVPVPDDSASSAGRGNPPPAYPPDGPPTLPPTAREPERVQFAARRENARGITRTLLIIVIVCAAIITLVIALITNSSPPKKPPTVMLTVKVVQEGSIGLSEPRIPVKVLQGGALTNIESGILNSAQEFVMNVPSGDYQVCIIPPSGWVIAIPRAHAIAGWACIMVNVGSKPDMITVRLTPKLP
jgi:hypothetical protein